MKLIDRLRHKGKEDAARPGGENTCRFCGKQLNEGQGPRVFTLSVEEDPFAASTVGDAAEEMLAGRRVCDSCGAIFCLECGNAEGRRQGLGSTNCPGCGLRVP